MTDKSELKKWASSNMPEGDPYCVYCAEQFRIQGALWLLEHLEKEQKQLLGSDDYTLGFDSAIDYAKELCGRK